MLAVVTILIAAKSILNSSSRSNSRSLAVQGEMAMMVLLGFLAVLPSYNIVRLLGGFASNATSSVASSLLSFFM